MSGTEFDIVIAGYIKQDPAQLDFDRLVKLVEDKKLEVQGAVLVSEDDDGEVTVKKTAAGGLVAKFVEHRVEKGIADKIEAGLAPGWAGVVAMYERSKGDIVDATLVGAAKKSVAQVDGRGANQFKAAMAKAAQGLKS